MAKIVRKIRTLGKIAVVLIIIYFIIVIVSVVTDIFSIVFIPLTVCMGFIWLITVMVCLSAGISGSVNTDILASGISGERVAAEVLVNTLPDSYTVFQNVIVTHNNKKSEIDNIVVGKSGVYIVEVKNHNGHIVGNVEDVHWMQHKVGRGGTPYANEMYSPVKQVGTHIYCLANYLRQNGVNTYIEGMVYFANRTCQLSLTGESVISVYASSGSGEEQLCRRILSGNHKLDIGCINYICELINQL